VTAPGLSVADRFWMKVDTSAGPDGCWLWTASLDGKGYGQLNIGEHRMRRAHRISLEIAGVELVPGMDVDHICRVRRCVNPAHLRQATRKQNMENLAKLPAHNTSGYRGVTWSKRDNRWRAYVQHNKRRTELGLFPTAAEAGEAARQTRLRIFTHSELDKQPTKEHTT
jgi:hypothetical protein